MPTQTALTDPALIDPALRPNLTMTVDECLDTAAAWEREAVRSWNEPRRTLCSATAGLWLNRALQGGYTVPR